jgi:phage/plasmid primase-like uncharacterized protein
MVAAVILWPAQEIMGIHRTFLDSQGRKANVNTPKMALGPVKGGAVRLRTHAATLAICEGIETGLAVSQSMCISVWCALSASNLPNVNLPDDVQNVVICADHDIAGLQAAERAATRYQNEGRAVSVATPPEPGQDFNDLLMGKA